jgi:hypothetical protein
MSSAVPYRLSIHGSLEKFRPEIEFVCAFLDQSYFVARAELADAVLHYGPDAPAGSIQVPAVLFPEGVRIDDAGIHMLRDVVAGLEIASPGLLPKDPDSDGTQTPSAGIFNYDAFGLIFLLLSRLEERGYPDLDKYTRFPITGSLIYRRGNLLAPICDRAAEEIAAALTGEPAPEGRSAYKVWLTHDYDVMRGYHYWHEPLRNMAGDILKRHQPGIAWRRLRRTYLSGEPWNSLNFILEHSERLGLQSYFFFMGRSTNSMDSPYMIRDPKLTRRVANEIAGRGHVIGFHPAFDTCRDFDEWMRQKRDVEEITGREVSTGRQHVLMFDAEKTWDIWNDGGMELDMTLSYPEETGFRTGTCRRHPTYSLMKRKTLHLLEYPSAIVDFGMFGGRYRDYTADQAIEDNRRVVDICRRRGGDLVILYHPCQYQDRTVRDWYAALTDVV